MTVQLALHHARDGNNPHGHLLCTLRRFEGGQLSDRKARDWNSKQLLQALRASWAEHVNAALKEAGRVERIDHRTLKARGIDREPQPKIGVAATAMRREGRVPDPLRVRQARQVVMLNHLRPMLRELERGGQVTHAGAGASWWERTAAFARVEPEAAPEGWHAFLAGRAAACHVRA